MSQLPLVDQTSRYRTLGWTVAAIVSPPAVALTVTGTPAASLLNQNQVSRCTNPLLDGLNLI